MHHMTMVAQYHRRPSTDNIRVLEEKDVLREIVRASDALRRKHRMIKLGRDDAERTIQDVFQLIVQPLEKLVNVSRKKPTIKREIKLEKTENNVKRDEEAEEDNADEEMGKERNEGNVSYGEHERSIKGQSPTSYDIEESFRSAERETISSNEDELINEYLSLLRSNRKMSIDVSHGVRILANDKLMIGDSPIDFSASSTIRVGEKNYAKTVGLVELLFEKEPADFTTDDLRANEKIIGETNAHSKYYKASGAIRADNSSKFKNYISRYLSRYLSAQYTAAKVCRNTRLRIKKPAKFYYVYWDDPNELVDRLRILLLSQAAGNQSHSNEIISIIEELREAKIVY